MSTNGLDAFDRTIHQTNIWLNEIDREIGKLGRQHAYHALRAVLHVLRDRLLPGEAAKVAAELPLLVRGVYYEGYKPDRAPLPLRTRDQFLAEIERRYELDEPTDPAVCARAVFGVMASHVSEGETRKIQRMLPTEIADLWPTIAGGG